MYANATHRTTRLIAHGHAGIIHPSLLALRFLKWTLRQIKKELALPNDSGKSYVEIEKAKVVSPPDGHHFCFISFFSIPYMLWTYVGSTPARYNTVITMCQSIACPMSPSTFRSRINRQFYIQPEKDEIEPCIVTKRPHYKLNEPA